MNMTSNVGTGSQRYNSGKVRMTYIPPAIQMSLQDYCASIDVNIPVHALVALAEHYVLGATKYPDSVNEQGFSFPNWAKGQYFDLMLMNSLLRHLYAFKAGEALDPDFGSHHLIAVAWGIACLHHQFTNYELYKQYDDRMWVGFGYYNTTIAPERDEIVQLLMMVSVEEDPRQACNMLVEAFYHTLAAYQWELHHEEPLNFNVSKERLQKIKSKDYGVPVISQSSTTRA